MHRILFRHPLFCLLSLFARLQQKLRMFKRTCAAQRRANYGQRIRISLAAVSLLGIRIESSLSTVNRETKTERPFPRAPGATIVLPLLLQLRLEFGEAVSPLTDSSYGSRFLLLMESYASSNLRRKTKDNNRSERGLNEAAARSRER